MYQILYDLCGIPAEGSANFSGPVAYLCIALVCIFIVMMIDFLARILSRFIPRWNRNS